TGVDAVILYGALVRAAQMAGALESLLEQSVRYATERRQFGRPIGNFQAIQHNLALLADHTAAAGMAAQHAFDVADHTDPRRAVAATGTQLVAPAAQAQAPKRGGTLRLTFQADPLHFDPHQTLSFVTMCPLSLVYSRLVKVKAGPSVKPMTYPVEADLAESWTQANDTTYVFKLKKGVRWHPKPPVNGRELTADDVKYTYE